MSDAIRLENITRTYGDGRSAVRALRGVSLRIRRGVILALTGPSGSGKTTLLNIVGGIDRADSGEAHVAGADLGRLSRYGLSRFRRKSVGFIFQHSNLIDELTAAENAELPLALNGVPRDVRRREAVEMLKSLGLADQVDSFPAMLSGGERQRVAVARALIHEPDILLADEPTANLDTARGEEVIRMIQRLQADRGVTAIVSTHDPAVAGMFSEKVVLRDGELDGGRRTIDDGQ